MYDHIWFLLDTVHTMNIILTEQRKDVVNKRRVSLTLQVCASHKLENLINEDDGEGELQHHNPLLHIQVRELEDHLWTRAAAC